MATGTAPFFTDVNPNTNRAYVSNRVSGTVSVIDGMPGSPTENQVIETIAGFSDNFGIALNSIVPNPVRDPSADVISGGKIIQCAFIAEAPHFSKFSVGTGALASGGSSAGDQFAPLFSGKYFEESGKSPLEINGVPFDLTEYENTIETQIVKTGVPTEFKFTLFENSGGDSIQHFEFLTNLTEKSQKYSDSDTFIIYDKNDELIIKDPHGLFSNVDFDLESNAEFEAVITMNITFAKAMAQSDIILRVWDSELNSRDTVLKNAIEIIGEDQSSIIEEVETEELSLESSDSSQDDTITETITSIPEWLKKNAGWWSQGQLDDSTFTTSVQYLIQNQIIDMLFQLLQLF